MVRVALYLSYYLLNLLRGVDELAFIGSLPLMLLCLFEVSKIKSAYFELADMFWFVMYLYFVIGPLQGIRNGLLLHGGPVDGYVMPPENILIACAIPFIFAIVVAATRWLRDASPAKPAETRIIPIEFAPILVGASLCFFCLYVMSTGFGNLFLARSQKVAVEGSAVLGTIFYGALIVSCALMTSIRGDKSANPFTYHLYLIPCLALLLLVANPLNSARYFVITAWLPIIFIYCRGRIRHALIYAGIAFGLTVLMPIMSVTSRFGIAGLADLSSLSDNVFNVPYIDVFDMLAFEVGYVDNTGFYWGGKTLGALFFFVPRSLWETKETLIAIDMGDLLVALGIAGTENLSLFFGGEFYADGGLIGVFIGSALLMYGLSKAADRLAFTVNGISVVEVLLLASMPILFRGPIGANLPLSVSAFAVYFGITRFVSFGVSMKERGKRPRRGPSRILNSEATTSSAAELPATDALPPIRW